MASQQDIAYQEALSSDDRSGSLYAASAVGFFLVSIALVGRFTSRWMSKSHLGWDDWLMAISLIFSFGVFSLNIVITKQGLGRHEVFLTERETFAVGSTMVEITYTTAISLIKLSTLILWGRIFPGRAMRNALYGIGAVVLAYSITQLVCVIVQCIPLSALWNPTIKGKCIELGIVFLVCSSFNIATDLAILLIPISRLWKLQLSTSKKIQLTGLFMLGSFVLIISIVRLPQLMAISITDESWTLTGTGIWSCLECAVATLSACLPVMRPLLAFCIPHLNKNSVSRNKSNANSQARQGSVSKDNENAHQSQDYKSMTDTLVAYPEQEQDIFKVSSNESRVQTTRNVYELGQL